MKSKTKENTRLNEIDFIYAVSFYAFALGLDAIITILYGNASLEANKYVLALANHFGFKFAVVIYSVAIFAVVFTLSFIMYMFGLNNTSFGLLVVLAIFHLHGAFTWLVDLGKSIKLPAIITIVCFFLFDLIEKRGKLNELVRF